MTVHEPTPVVHLEGSGGLRVPFTRVALTNGETFDRYATEGPGSDPEVGLPRLREQLDRRPRRPRGVRRPRDAARSTTAGLPSGEEPPGTSGAARKPNPARRSPAATSPSCTTHAAGVVTPEMEFVAAPRGRATPSSCATRWPRGRAIIPANVNHPESEPMIIGRNFLVKINANIGNSAVTSSIEEEVEKMTWAITLGRRHGDGPLHRPTTSTRPASGSCATARCPIGTVPIYQALEKVDGEAEELTWEIYRDTVDRAVRAGRRLLHRPRRRAAALRPAHRRARHRHRLPRRLDHGRLVPRAPRGELPLHALRRALRDHARRTTCRSASATGCGPGRSPTPTTRPSSPSCARWAS